jgi:tRNA(Ile)-lysidine synthetase-like protein
MSESLVAKVRTSLAEQRMVGAGDTLVVAVSGGPDSLCLLHVLDRLRDELAIALHVAHLDHMLRGAESADDARFVAETAQAWRLPATVAAIDVRAAAHAERTNLHQAGRRARYRFLADVARARGARAVAVAHTADDQAETLLMHLLRGAGPAGLRGMRAVVPWEEWALDKQTRGQADKENSCCSVSPGLLISPSLVRPLLQVTRAEIEAYLAAHSLQPRRDPTNLERNATRNRIRHDLLPDLIEYNPHIIAALSRTAALCAAEHDLVQRELQARWPALVRERDGALDFAGDTWRELHPALQREALRYAYTRLGGNATLQLDHVEEARALAGRGVGGQYRLPGGIPLTVGYNGTFTIGGPPAIDGPQLAGPEIALPVPGRASLGSRWAIESAYCPPPAPPASAREVYLDADQLAGPLVVRCRRPGERFRPAGGRGSRRLQDIFVDAKVPRALRDSWPVVATPQAIVWVPGLRAAADLAATAATRRVLQLRLVGGAKDDES